MKNESIFYVTNKFVAIYLFINLGHYAFKIVIYENIYLTTFEKKILDYPGSEKSTNLE